MLFIDKTMLTGPVSHGMSL